MINNEPGSDATNNSDQNSPNKYDPTGREKDLRDWVHKRMIAMKDNPERLKAEKIWRKGREQWEALRKDRGADEWQSNHYVPLTTAVIETAMSELIDQSPKPMILARGSEDIPKATIMEHVFEYSWEVADSDLEEEDVLHDALVCGTGIAQEYYWKNIRKIKTSLKKGSKTDYNEENQADFDDCYLECVRLEDFYVDELARSFHGPYGARDCIRRYIMDIQAFRQFFQGTWDPLGNAKYVKPGGDTNYYDLIGYTPPDSIDKSKQVEVLWYWSVAPEDLLVIVANGVVVVAGPNPYKHKQLPFARAVDIKRTHTFYGKGEAELLESIQDEMNTLRRMMIDRNHLDIDKMFYGPSRINLTDEDTIARPHGFIPADEDIKPVEYGDTPRSVELGLNHLEDDSTISSGINPRAEALPTTGTATEAAILKESTLKRIRLKVRRFEREFLTRIARLRVANILQFYSQPRLEEIIGTEGTQQYENEETKLQAQGLVQENGKTYQQKYRQIPLTGKEFTTGAEGQPMIQDSAQAYSFFELKPEYFLPKASGYNVKIAAGSTLPISKALIQSRAQEAFDRLLPVAQDFQNTYDPKKLGDVLVLKPLDINPSDVSVDQPMQNEADKRALMLVQLATQENKMMMQGKAIPPTPYSSAAHTAVHVEFTSSPTFQQLPANDPRIQIFTDHIVGELTAQSQREGGQSPDQAAQGGNSGLPGAEAGGNRDMNSALPGRIQGGPSAAAATPGVIGGR